MRFRLVLILLSAVLINACSSLPKGIDPVQSFDVQRYLGTWYEIARLDHRFERGLSNVSAEYVMQDDGQITVINRAFDDSEQVPSEATGKAKFARNTDEGFLKVSFFGPFYGSYVVFNLDDDYSRAYVAGNDRSSLWFLSRTPTVSEQEREAFVSTAQSLGFNVDELIFVDQSRS